MSPRAKGRVTDCSSEQARARRAQARAFLDVAELVLEEPSTQSDPHVQPLGQPYRRTHQRAGTAACRR